MKGRMSLQWRLTFMTALLVTVACVVLNFSISSSALFSMNELGDSIIAVLPMNPAAQGGATELVLDPDMDVLAQIESASSDFLVQSAIATLVIVLASSAMTYFVVGYALRPLKRLSEQVATMEASRISQPVDVGSAPAEIWHLADAFNTMLRRLDGAFEAQRRYAANAAHELRTPLAVMRAKLDVLRKRREPTAREYADALQMVDEQTERLGRVVDVLLQMADLRTARRDDTIHLAEIAEEVLCDLADPAAARQIRLRQEGVEATVPGNETLIYRAIYNLVENAVKYGAAGGEVIVRVEDDGRCATVAVINDGSPIDASEREKIFEPFYRIDGSRSRDAGGAGLGLALVREVALRHAGGVRVTSDEAGRTRMEITLAHEAQPEGL